MFAGFACSDAATARSTRKVGAVLCGRHGLHGHFPQPVFCGCFVHCFRCVFLFVLNRILD